MRPITRMRTLAALCALLMLLSSVPATAWVERPIDDPQGPPVVKPTEVGDPDSGSGLPQIMRATFYSILIAHPAFRGMANVILGWSTGARSTTPRWR